MILLSFSFFLLCLYTLIKFEFTIFDHQNGEMNNFLQFFYFKRDMNCTNKNNDEDNSNKTIENSLGNQESKKSNEC